MVRIITLVFFVGFMATIAVAQDSSLIGKPRLQHDMTPDELLRKDEIGRSFIETDPPAGPVRNVAEFDRMQGVLVRYPFGIPVSLIREMATDVTVTTLVATVSQKNAVLSTYIANNVDTSHCNFLLALTDSYWTRDYGPWFETDSADQIGIIDFPYNRPRPNDDEIPKKIAAMLGIPWFGMNVISTGGNYMTDGFGNAASTDLVWEENQSQTHTQIAQKMNNYLGIETFHVVPDPNTTTPIDHIDCWGKFLAPDKILIRKTLFTDPEYALLESAASYWAAQTCAYGYNYKVFRVKTPQDQPYTNSVILNNKVLVPFMNSPWDDSAKAVYEAAMPGYEVIGFIGLNPPNEWISSDALHCRVMGIADIGLLHIRHMPLSGNHPCETDYVLNADVIASSHMPVKPDSVLIHYQVNGGLYQTAALTHTAGNHYTGIIPKQPAGSVIKYYLSAADQSGRHANAPFIGSADPFIFHTVYTNLAAVPDTLWFITPSDCLAGKISQLHNMTGDTLSLNAVQMFGQSLPWWVDSISVTVPGIINPGDSGAIRVRMPLPVNMNPFLEYEVDSLSVTTSSGVFHVIIMVNRDLLASVTESPHLSNIGSNYPNPFSAVTSIPLEIREHGPGILEILDSRGLKVKTLIAGVFEPGSTTIKWDGTDDNANKLPGGIYFCRLISGNGVQTISMALIR